MVRERDEMVWRWANESVLIGLDRLGSGPTVLLLPALSSISTRAEMHPLQERLSDRFTAIAIDWPGFGDQPRPRLDWRPETYQAFLAHLLTELVPQPFATVAAGHAAGYLLVHAAAAPGSAGRLCLIAPTWRGPLPTMVGKRLPLFKRLGRAGDHLIVGPIIYRLNVNRPVVRMIARDHVYADQGWHNDARMAENGHPSARSSIRVDFGSSPANSIRCGLLDSTDRQVIFDRAHARHRPGRTFHQVALVPGPDLPLEGHLVAVNIDLNGVEFKLGIALQRVGDMLLHIGRLHARLDLDGIGNADHASQLANGNSAAIFW